MFAKEHLHKKIHLHWLIVQILGEKVKKKKIKKFSLSFWQMEATLDKLFVCTVKSNILRCRSILSLQRATKWILTGPGISPQQFEKLEKLVASVNYVTGLTIK